MSETSKNTLSQLLVSYFGFQYIQIGIVLYESYAYNYIVGMSTVR